MWMQNRKLNLHLYQGTDFRKSFFSRTPQGVVNDLTGYQARAVIQSSYEPDEGEILLDMTTANARLVIVPAEGRINMVLSAADLNVAWRFGFWDLKVTAPEGVVDRFRYGYVTLRPKSTP
jgi:hypothetical protein